MILKAVKIIEGIIKGMQGDCVQIEEGVHKVVVEFTDVNDNRYKITVEEV